MKIMLNNVRLAFPHLFKPEPYKDGEPAYSCLLILAPDHPQLEELRRAQEAVGAEKWGRDWPQIKKQLEAKDRLALHDGDTKAKHAGFAGNFFLSARTKPSARPTVLDRNKSPLVEADGRPYAGCYVNASIDLYAQKNGYGNGVNTQLRGVQFARDGDAFGGGAPASADEFAEVAEGADAADLA